MQHNECNLVVIKLGTFYSQRLCKRYLSSKNKLLFAVLTWAVCIEHGLSNLCRYDNLSSVGYKWIISFEKVFWIFVCTSLYLIHVNTQETTTPHYSSRITRLKSLRLRKLLNKSVLAYRAFLGLT